MLCSFVVDEMDQINSKRKLSYSTTTVPKKGRSSLTETVEIQDKTGSELNYAEKGKSSTETVEIQDNNGLGLNSAENLVSNDNAIIGEKEFSNLLLEATDSLGGLEKIEKSKAVISGNQKLTQEIVGITSNLAIKTLTKAQYGRSSVSFVSQAIELLNLSKTDRFVDIGSGIGTVVLQVALTVGSELTAGIELCKGRYEVATWLKLKLKAIVSANNPNMAQWFDNINFYHGDFRESKYFFDVCRTATVLFVNNAETIFSVRSARGGNYTLDYHVARLACGLPNGARILSFEKLVDLPFTAFSCREFESAEGATSWTEISMKTTKFYVYTKISGIWTCPTCTFDNTLLRESKSEWKESIRELCESCSEDPRGSMRRYSLRSQTH